mgnify:CR=1 FL=1
MKFEKLTHFARGFVYAYNGIRAAIREERNFRFHLCAALYAFVAAYWAQLPAVETALIALCVAAVLALLLRRVVRHPLGVAACFLVVAGGLGNIIDRVRLGYVVDMFNFQFIRYPVFNVADIFVVVGIIGFAAYYLLLDDKVRGQKETAGKHMEPPAEEQGHGQDHSADGQ